MSGSRGRGDIRRHGGEGGDVQGRGGNRENNRTAEAGLQNDTGAINAPTTPEELKQFYAGLPPQRNQPTLRLEDGGAPPMTLNHVFDKEPSYRAYTKRNYIPGGRNEHEKRRYGNAEGRSWSPDSKEEQTRSFNPRCWTCGEGGHRASDCPDSPNCPGCGEVGHQEHDYPQVNKQAQKGSQNNRTGPRQPKRAGAGDFQPRNPSSRAVQNAPVASRPKNGRPQTSSRGREGVSVSRVRSPDVSEVAAVENFGTLEDPPLPVFDPPSTTNAAPAGEAASLSRKRPAELISPANSPVSMPPLKKHVSSQDGSLMKVMPAATVSVIDTVPALTAECSTRSNTPNNDSTSSPPPENKSVSHRDGTVSDLASSPKEDLTMAVVPFHNKVESPPSPCFEISARKTRESINLLAGPAIEVVVGNDSTPPSGKRRVWWLPKNLLSHRSSFFREACDITMGEPGQPRIELASDDPIIFAFFVEWLYYEGYTAVHPVWDESIEHAAAWVLGAKLKTPEFQDHAMGHLYRIHNDVHRPQPLTSREVDYACANSPPGSYLRWLYFDLMSEHFSRRERVQGPTAEWEEVLKKHSEAMTALLGRLRDGSQQKFVRGPEAYMVKKDVQSEALLENDDVQSNADMENVDAQSDTCMENAYVRSDVSML